MKVISVKESDVYVARISPDDRRSEVYGYMTLTLKLKRVSLVNLGMVQMVLLTVSLSKL